MNSIEKILRHTHGGCPKRNICSFHRAENQTCLNGPYTYCGKYRSIVNPERKEKFILP
jgi:hypothetical protein